jgi:DNA-3-methyladenine glycosylase
MQEGRKYSNSGRILKIRSLIEMDRGKRLPEDFFIRDVLNAAPELIGKILVISTDDGGLRKYMITETEAYRGYEDKSCHASHGKTKRNEIMFHAGGRVYVYFVYGMYWMLNFVTGEKDDPQAALIRGIEGFNGPGKLTKELGINKSFYGENLAISDRIWVEDNGLKPSFKTGPRIGVDYAGEIWKNKPWRYYIEV